MIKNIIFDLGGVIMTISHDEALRRFKELGLTDAERHLDPYTQSGIFGDVEEGKITAEEFRSSLSRLVGRELTFDECKHAWLGYRKDVPKRNLDALKELSRMFLKSTSSFRASCLSFKNFSFLELFLFFTNSRRIIMMSSIMAIQNHKSDEIPLDCSRIIAVVSCILFNFNVCLVYFIRVVA